ncbi:MAG: metallopeptidase family protein [Candidatus Riflebacteria bacterium]|nr:metallopeptidase family protein [Candidatus Riflebacteria bacterium]
MVRKSISRIPKKFRKEISLYNIQKKTLPSPERMKGLYILGTYQHFTGFTGPVISIYYGSFRKIFPGADLKRIYSEIKKTLFHELLHHWEAKSGVDDLSDEDRRKIIILREKCGLFDSEKARKQLIEALLFVYIVFTSIAIAAKLID